MIFPDHGNLFGSYGAVVSPDSVPFAYGENKAAAFEIDALSSACHRSVLAWTCPCILRGDRTFAG